MRYKRENIREAKRDYIRVYLLRASDKGGEGIPVEERDAIDSEIASAEELTSEIPASVLRVWEAEADILSNDPATWAIYINGV